MYFEDLTTYAYHNEPEDSLNIGWLERGHSFHKGSVPEEFMNKLWKYLRYPVRIFRGSHICDLCEGAPIATHEDIVKAIKKGIWPSPWLKQDTNIIEYKGQKRRVGYYELRVWGKNGKVYAAPSLIVHYILQHDYQPPQEFIDAVMDSEDVDSDEYYQKVLTYSNGEDFWLAKDQTKI
ncbi:MAG: hypothetical protein NC413_00180 [Muribaculum sp.]|nr:hypothetical protein [Muribaculum sp.]